MRKYLVKATARKYNWKIEDLMERLHNPAAEWKVSEVIIAEDGWEAIDKFQETNNVDADEIDDIYFSDIGAADVFITSKRTAYIPDKCNTMTVKELIKCLEEFDPESKIYTVDFGTGFGPNVYGPIDYDSIWEVTSEEEE